MNGQMSAPSVPPTPLLDVATQCRNKIRYDLFAEAHDECIRLADKEPGKLFTVYVCPHCWYYHVGRVP